MILFFCRKFTPWSRHLGGFSTPAHAHALSPPASSGWNHRASQQPSASLRSGPTCKPSFSPRRPCASRLQSPSSSTTRPVTCLPRSRYPPARRSFAPPTTSSTTHLTRFLLRKRRASTCGSVPTRPVVICVAHASSWPGRSLWRWPSAHHTKSAAKFARFGTLVSSSLRSSACWYSACVRLFSRSARSATRQPAKLARPVRLASKAPPPLCTTLLVYSFFY